MYNKHIVERLIIYNRVLKELSRAGIKRVTSAMLAEKLSKTSSQIRRDFSEVGKKGKPGVGYNVEELVQALDRDLGLNRKWGVALVGAGNLGRALFYYPGFKKEGFEFRAVFDSDPSKVGKVWSGIRIASTRDFKKKIKKKNIEIGIIAVPASGAPEVAKGIIGAGVKALLNFAPVTLDLPSDIYLRYADLAMDMENLSCYLSEKKKI